MFRRLVIRDEICLYTGRLIYSAQAQLNHPWLCVNGVVPFADHASAVRPVPNIISSRVEHEDPYYSIGIANAYVLLMGPGPEE